MGRWVVSTVATVQPAESPHLCPYCHTRLEVEVGEDDGPRGDGRVRFWLHCPRPGCTYDEEDRTWVSPTLAALHEITRMSRQHRTDLLGDVSGAARRLLEWRLGT